MISLIYKDSSGTQRGEDEVRFSIVVWGPVLHGPESIIRAETGRFEVYTNQYNAEIPGVVFSNWQFMEENGAKTVTRTVNTGDREWDGILVAPGTVSVYVDHIDRGLFEILEKEYTIIPRTGDDWVMPYDSCPIETYKNHYPEDPLKVYPSPPGEKMEFGQWLPGMIIDGEGYTYYTISEASGPNKGIYYIESTRFKSDCLALVNRFLLGSTDPPADNSPPGVYTIYDPDNNQINVKYALSVELHETWGTDANPPLGLVVNADGHHKLFWNYIQQNDLRALIEPEVGYGSEEDFDNYIYNLWTQKWNHALEAANSEHENWKDPFPLSTAVYFWDATENNWYLAIPSIDY